MAGGRKDVERRVAEYEELTRRVPPPTTSYRSRVNSGSRINRRLKRGPSVARRPSHLIARALVTSRSASKAATALSRSSSRTSLVPEVSRRVFFDSFIPSSSITCTTPRSLSLHLNLNLHPYAYAKLLAPPTSTFPCPHLSPLVAISTAANPQSSP